MRESERNPYYRKRKRELNHQLYERVQSELAVFHKEMLGKTPEEIYDIAMFAASLKGVKKLHLLPYHRLGQGKYDGLGREYKLDGIDLIPNEYMQELLEVAKKSGLECQIGG